MKVLSVLFATALAHSVFPVPGGPYNRTPFGGSIPRLAKRSGWRYRDQLVQNVIYRKADLKQWQLDNLPQLLDLLLAPSHIGIGDRRSLFDLHHRDGGIDLGR